MAATPVSPQAGINTTTTTAGSPVLVFPANINGGYITNPATASSTLFIDPTGAAPLQVAQGTTFGIVPGQTWYAIPGQTTTTSLVSTDANHEFTAIYF